MNHSLLIPRRNHKTARPKRNLRKWFADVCTFWSNFAHYVKRGHRVRQAWALAGVTLP